MSMVGVSAGRANVGVRWTAAEDAVIRQHYETHTDRQIADMLTGRNRKAVHERRGKLRLWKYGSRRSADVEIVRCDAEGAAPKPSETCPITMTRAEMSEVSGMKPEAAMMTIMERRGYL